MAAGAGVAILVSFVALLAWSSVEYWRIREPLHAKVTVTRMCELMYVLEDEQPTRTDAKSIRRLLEKERRPELAEDDWGTGFVVERNSQGKYVIISLGRDRRRGSCCTKWVSSWDEDAVLSGNEWLQVWNQHAAAGKPGGQAIE